MKRNVLSIAAVVAAAALALSACGSSKSSSSATTASGSGTTASAGGAAVTTPATASAIKVGMLNPEGAPFYNAPDELAANKAAIRDINAHGGVSGHPIQLDWCNESNGANKAAACARQFVSNGDVATLNSITVTNPGDVTSILSAAGIANVNYGALTTGEFSATNNFPFDGAAAWENAGVTGAVVHSYGIKKIVMVRNDNPQTPPIESLVRKAVAKEGGTVVGPVLIPPTAIADYSPYAQQIISSGADAADIPLGIAQALGIVKAVRALGDTKMVFLINSGAFANKDLSSAGSSVDGTYIFAPNPWVGDTADYPGINQFLTDMKAELATGDTNADVNTARPFALKDWESVFAMAQVMKQMLASGQQITASSFLSAFKAAKDLPTVFGITWSPSQDQTAVSGYSNVSNTKGFLLIVKNGQQVLAQKAPVDVLNYLS